MKRLFEMLQAAGRRGMVHDRSGNVTIETAILALPLFLFLFTLINAGHALWLQNALDMAVTDAARCASVNPTLCGTASQIKAYAAGRSGAGFDSSIFSFAQASCGNRVSATYPLPLLLAGQPLNLTAQACYPQLPPSAS